MIPRKLKTLFFYSIILFVFIITGFCNLNFSYIRDIFVQRDTDQPLRTLDHFTNIANQRHKCSINSLDNDEEKYCQLEYSCPTGNEYPREDIDLITHDYTELNRLHGNISSGGIWQPCTCVPRTKLAIIIPYRDRDVHLRVFLNNIIPFLQEQQVAFRIFVVEQTGKELFNRAALLNVGYTEALLFGDFDCFIFHDVDLIPEDWCNLYKCGKNPRHLAVAISKFRYKLPYEYYCGGALALNNVTMATINGFSDIMFGWGGEDDDTYARFIKHGYKIIRYDEIVGKYTMIEHSDDKGNPKRVRTDNDIINYWMYSAYDGLNTLNYTVMERTLYPLYTKITVSLQGPTTIAEAKQLFQETAQSLRSKLFKDKKEKENIHHIVKQLAKQKQYVIADFFKEEKPK